MRKITSKDNKYLKHAVSLKHKKYRMREQMFLLEGKKVVAEALKKGIPLVRIMVDEAHCGDYQFLFEQYPQAEWFLVDSRIFKYLADTETPQGIIALAGIPCYEFSMLLGRNNCLILLDQIADPGNLGTIIRTAWALNIDGILLTEGCTDPFSPKVVRSSMGGILHVPVYTSVGLEHIEQLKSSGYKVAGTALNAAASVFDGDYKGANIIVIGSESRGVSSHLLACCDSLIKIPINPEVDSLNAAIACAIIMMEISKQRNVIPSSTRD